MEKKIITYKQSFEEYPNSWILVLPVERDNLKVKKMAVLYSSICKDEVMDKARLLRKEGIKAAVITTIENANKMTKYLCSRGRVYVDDYVSPSEYSEMFRWLYGFGA